MVANPSAFISSPGPDSKFQVNPAKVRFETTVAEDEIDLDSGFLMLPQAIPQPAPTGEVPGLTPPGPGPGGAYPPGPDVPPGPLKEPLVGPAPSGGDKIVELSLTANRDQLFTSWNALANLADLAGKVQVTVRAESNQAFEC